MLRLIAAAALLTLATAPAMAQGTITPYGTSIYGGSPQGYIYSPNATAGEPSDIAQQALRRFSPPRVAICSPYGCQ